MEVSNEKTQLLEFLKNGQKWKIKAKRKLLFWKFLWKFGNSSYKTVLPVAFNFLLSFIFRKFIMFWRGEKVKNKITALQMEKMRKVQLHTLLRTKERTTCCPSKKIIIQGKLMIETIWWNREEKFRSRCQRDVIVLIWLTWPIRLSQQECWASISVTFCAGSLRCQQICHLLAKWPHLVYSRKIYSLLG